MPLDDLRCPVVENGLKVSFAVEAMRAHYSASSHNWELHFDPRKLFQNFSPIFRAGVPSFLGVPPIMKG